MLVDCVQRNLQEASPSLSRAMTRLRQVGVKPLTTSEVQLEITCRQRSVADLRRGLSHGTRESGFQIGVLAHGGRCRHVPVALADVPARGPQPAAHGPDLGNVASGKCPGNEPKAKACALIRGSNRRGFL